jgi:hypothetical protein
VEDALSTVVHDVRRLACVLLVGALGCNKPHALPPCIEAPPDGGPAIDTGGDPVLLAAGDIADPGDTSGAESTAELLDRTNGVVATLGDNVHGDGNIDLFLGEYARTWGRHRWRTHPAVGNHEYFTPMAGPYFAYFCAAAGPALKGFYSYDLGAWHVVVLNSMCVEGKGPPCDEGSEQLDWLRADLAAHRTACTLAVWHHPRFSSAAEGDAPPVSPMYQALVDAGAELLLSGHAHNYERFAPQDVFGHLDATNGIRQLVVGTGGGEHAGFGTPEPNSEVRVENQWGIIELTLHARSYEFRFLTVDGVVADSGSEPCH